MEILDENISLEARYPQVYRKQGIRFTSKLLKPDLYTLTELEEIDFAAWHYFYPQEEMKSFGISQEHPLVKGRKKKTAIYHVLDYNEVFGPTKRKIFNHRLAMKVYHKENKSLFWLRKETFLSKFDSKRLWNIIYDYSLMGRTQEHRPRPNRFIEVFLTQYNSYLYHIAKAVRSTDRQHFIFYHLPDKIPSIQQFNLATKELKRNYWKLFPSFKELALLDLWKWLDNDKRNDSIFGKTFGVKDFEKLNFIFLYKGQFAWISLSKLNELLLQIEEEPDGADEDENESGNANVQKIRKYFFRFLNAIVSQVKSLPQEQMFPEQQEIKQAETLEKTYNTTDEKSIPDNIGDAVEEEEAKPVPIEEVSVKEGELKPENVEVSLPEEKKEPEDNEAEIPLREIQKVEDNPPSVVPPKEEPIKPPFMVNPVEENKTFRMNEDFNLLGFTPKEQKLWEKKAEIYKDLKNPFDSSKTLEQTLEESPKREISLEELKVPDMGLVTDKSMLTSKNKVRQQKYIEEQYKTDLIKSTLSLQAAGVNVLNYEVEEQKDVASEFEIHHIQVQPTGGAASTIKIKLPKINPDGTFKSGTVTYFLKNQRTDKPIRKVNENRVALTTAYGKLFVSRSEKMKYDVSKWLLKEIEKNILDGKLVDVEYGITNIQYDDLPAEIAFIAQRYKSIKNKSSGLILDLSNIGRAKQKDPLYYFGHGVEYDGTTKVFKQGNHTFTLEEILDIETQNVPISFAEVDIIGKKVPVGFLLARYLGMDLFLSLLNIQPATLDYEGRPDKAFLEKHPYHLIFRNKLLGFNKQALSASQELILNGLKVFEKKWKNLNYEDLESKDVFGVILTDFGLSRYHEVEMDLLDDMFIDPISRDILIQMKEPIEFKSLLKRAVELLATSKTVDEINMDDMVIRGYDRIPSLVYGQLAKKMKAFRMKPVTAKRKFEMGPEDVWQYLSRDPSKEIVDEINPIHAAKEKAVVTFSGHGGRDILTMNSAKSRTFNDGDFGIISEATVDSGDVGYTSYMSSNPTINNTLGLKDGEVDTSSPASMVSSAFLTAPFLSNDNAPRQNFLQIQASHRIPIVGAFPSPIRTGKESTIAHEIGDRFAFVAQEDGIISELTDKVAVFTYKSGKVVTKKLGTNIASSKGAYYKHVYVCDLEKNYKFKQGEVLCYNESFFTRDVFEPTQVILKDKIFGKVMFIESNDTLEDSVSIDESLGEYMETTSVKERTIVLKADNILINPVLWGETVEPDKELFLIDDNIGSGLVHSKFDEYSLDILRKLSHVSPKAGVKGKVIKIECFYFCEEEELSPSIKELVNHINRHTYGGTKIKVKDKRDLNGKINEPLRFGAQDVGPGQVCIRYYIESNLGMGVGDKVVISNQLKAVVGRTFKDPHITEFGERVDIMFSYSSVSNRIVTSAETIGTLYGLLKHTTIKALEAYDNG